MSLEHELTPGQIKRLAEFRAGANKAQKREWYWMALVDAIDMIDEMVATRAAERDAIDLIRDLVAKRDAKAEGVKVEVEGQ